MKISPTYKHVFSIYFRSACTGLGILSLIILFMVCMLLIDDYNGSISSASIGFDISSIIFIYILAFTLKSKLSFSMQYGVSRKEFYKANISALFTISLLASLVITTGEYFISFIPDINISLFTFTLITIRENLYAYFMLFCHLFSFVTISISIGNLAGIINAIIPKRLRLIMYGTLFILVGFVLPTADINLFDAYLFNLISDMLKALSITPELIILPTIALCSILLGIGYYLIKKIEIE